MQPESPAGPDAAGGGGGIVPDGPVLPDAVPSGVRNLVNGIFSFGGDLGRGFGSFVSDLAAGINGGGGDAAAMILPGAIDQLVATSGVIG